jgi:hypothetical protein
MGPDSKGNASTRVDAPRGQRGAVPAAQLAGKRLPSPFRRRRLVKLAEFRQF